MALAFFFRLLISPDLLLGSYAFSLVTEELVISVLEHPSSSRRRASGFLPFSLPVFYYYYYHFTTTIFLLPRWERGPFLFLPRLANIDTGGRMDGWSWAWAAYIIILG